MLAESSDNTEYKPLYKRFKQEPFPKESFCERHEFSIKFACMIIFSLSLILCGAVLSELIQVDSNEVYN